MKSDTEEIYLFVEDQFQIGIVPVVHIDDADPFAGVTVRIDLQATTAVMPPDMLDALRLHSRRLQGT